MPNFLIILGDRWRTVCTCRRCDGRRHRIRQSVRHSQAAQFFHLTVSILCRLERRICFLSVPKKGSAEANDDEEPEAT
jgi:hypothetical protein